MNDRTELYDRLAQLFAYPKAAYAGRSAALLQELGERCPAAAESLEIFTRELDGMTHAEIEECFTRTFDLNPVCCPEVGWHLFGERYDRGAFLVWMRGQLRDFGLQEQEELSDHLMHVLPVLGRMQGDDAKGFSTEAIQPALDKMIQSLSGKKNPFEAMLLAVKRVLESDHGPTSTRLYDMQMAAFGNPEPTLGARK